ncbi:hypothetical protein EK904_001972 [Melospiza melodia maxima]|nr:hypothetical protein EK904_001972 [Melospiza melodia maxima]
MLQPLQRRSNSKFERYRAFIFSLTFLLYASFHLSRKPISIVKGELHKHCASQVELDSYKEYAAQIQPVKKPFNASQCGWEPFDKSNYKQLLGALDYSFLCAYAVGMYLSGLIGERLPIRYYLTGGMLASGLFTAMFGLGYFYNVHNLWFYIMAQIANGLVQTTGWPSVVTCIGNWFGKGRPWKRFCLDPKDVSCSCTPSSSSKTFLNGASRCRIQMPTLNAKENGKPQDAEMQHLLSENENSSMATGEGRHGTSAISFLGALRIPGVVEFSLCLLFAKLVSYTFLFWLPLYITNVEHLDAKRAGDLSTLFDVGGIFGGILAGLISDRLEKRASTCGMMLLLAAPTLYMFSAVSKMGLEATIGYPQEPEGERAGLVHGDGHHRRDRICGCSFGASPGWPYFPFWLEQRVLHAHDGRCMCLATLTPSYPEGTSVSCRSHPVQRALSSQSWDEECARGWSCSLRTPPHGTPDSVFEGSLCGEEPCRIPGSSVRYGKPLEL